MALPPAKSSPRKIFNIMDLLRGNFDFTPSGPEAKTQAYGAPELISTEARTKILGGAYRATDDHRRRHGDTSNYLMSMVNTSLSKVGAERIENRKILQLVPEVAKAARLMTASTLSPNDLSNHEIPVDIDNDDITDALKKRLSAKITEFFQKKLNLKTETARWIYQFGYESGACVFGIVPLRSFEKIQEDSYVGAESFINKVIEPLCHDSLFGFGDSPEKRLMISEVQGLESFSNKAIAEIFNETEKADVSPLPGEAKALIENILATERLNLTDNPDVLHAHQMAKTKREKRTTENLHRLYKRPSAEPVIPISAARDPMKNGGVAGNPILMRLPPESVTVIHTPGDPNDHQGYLILLDGAGNPVNAAMQEEANAARTGNSNGEQASLFGQVYNAYGVTTGAHGQSREETNARIYSQIVAQHIKNRLGKAGFTNAEMGNLDSVFRCMFNRFIQAKQTRILFLPNDLVTYMTFEKDQNGYGVSRLDGVKFNLGMKMAVQVSRVMAAIKAAMDRRKIDVQFTENFMEQPESMFQSIVSQYVQKNTMSFSIDPNQIQTQIADKSLSITGSNIPGMEEFRITNEPDQRTGAIDFDPAILDYLDKQIINGLRVPASAMNELNENEYSRSVATTNLFFSMDISVDQDIVKRDVSDLLKKYARYSEEFHRMIYEIAPGLNPSKDKSSIDKPKSDGKEEDREDLYALPEHYTIDHLIDQMMITLPKPNVAPSTAQFQSLEAMQSAITSMITALFPDDLVGAEDSLRPVISFIRAKFISVNIRAYLASSGMGHLEIPDTNFTSEMKEMNQLFDALKNIQAMMEDKAKLSTPADGTGGLGTTGVATTDDGSFADPNQSDPSTPSNTVPDY